MFIYFYPQLSKKIKKIFYIAKQKHANRIELDR